MFSRRGALGAMSAGLVVGQGGAARAAAAEAPPFKPEVATRLKALAATLGVPGVSLSIARDGRPVGYWSTGYASLPFQVPVSPRTLFHTGSNGKHVTALGVLQLAEAGKLSIEEPLGAYLKDLPEAWARRPIRSLLSHTSGIPDYGDDFADWDRPMPTAEIIKKTGVRPALFEPFHAWSYSNTNYVLLGAMLERLSGLSYEAYVRTRLFQRAGLPDARPDAAQEVISNRAEPYAVREGHVSHAVQMENGVSAMPDGGLLFSARDTAPWGAALATNRLVSAASFAKMTTPTRLTTGRDVPYGFGWFPERTRGHAFHRHGGAVPGFLSMFARLPEQGLMMTCLTNGPANSAVLLDMCLAAAEAVAPGSTWVSKPPMGDGTDERSRRVRALLEPAKGAARPAGFAEEIQVLLKGPIAEYAVGRAQTPLKSVVPVEEYPVQGGRMVRYRLTDQKRTFHRLVGFTDDDRIFWI